MALDNDEIALKISTIDHEWSKNHDIHYLSKVCGLMKERVHKLDEILTKGHFYFTHPTQYDMDTIAKKYKTDLKLHFLSIGDLLINNANTANDAQSLVKGYIAQHNLKLGEILPVLRICISGTLQGPDLFASMDVLGHKTSGQRIKEALLIFEA